MGKSLKEYITGLGHWGWVVLIEGLFGISGAYFDISGSWRFPTWLWVMLLGVAFIIVPFLVFHKMRVKLQTKLDDIERAQPDANVRYRVFNKRAILEVTNTGATGEFIAKARVVDGNVQPELYTMYWESHRANSCRIDAMGTQSILLAEIAQQSDPNRNLFPGSLSLFKMGTSGEQVFGVSSLENHNARELNDRYPTMATSVPEDSCTVEITITSTPSLVRPLKTQRYRLRIDHTGKEDQLVLVPESGPDKVGSPN